MLISLVFVGGKRGEQGDVERMGGACYIGGSGRL
jgi:hypothetical protein